MTKKKNKSKNLKSIKPDVTEADKSREKTAQEHEQMADDKGHVYMRFNEDKIYNGDLLYTKDRIHKVPVNMKDRWLKRGGVICTQEEVDMEADLEKEIADSGDLPEGDEPFVHDKSGEVDLTDGQDLDVGNENGDDSL